jgi:Arc/MetJ-type ribon-helix-helix transcriptional regulator
MALSVNITMSMPPEMVEKIDEAVSGTKWSRSKYIRHTIAAADGSPFKSPEGELPSVENLQANEAGGVA